MARITLSEFAGKMTGLMPVMMKGFMRRMKSFMGKDDVTFLQFVVLQFLAEEGGSRMTDLAKFLGVSTATTTGVVDRLVKSGCIVRVFDPEDRRIIKVAVTAKGGERVAKVMKARQKMIMDIFGKISQSDREDYLRILTSVCEILKGGK